MLAWGGNAWHLAEFAIALAAGVAASSVALVGFALDSLIDALLAGLGLNAAFGWWWADPLAAIVIAVVAVREGVQGWRGEVCSCCA